jgi:tetraacyldisaccharide 4'-kinase
VTLAAMAVADLAIEVLVLDDGFQHRRLARDLDLVLLDATDPWGCGYLFPRGGLREPLAELRRASAVILTRSNQVDGCERGRLREAVIRTVPGVPIIGTSHRPIDLVNGEQVTVGLEGLSGKTVAAFCGLGNPEAFRQTLIDLGANVVAWRTFADHYRYSEDDVRELQIWAERLPATCLIATTQKDLVKIRRTHLGGKELWAVRICLHVDTGEKEFHRMLDKVMDKPSCVREERPAVRSRTVAFDSSLTSDL